MADYPTESQEQILFIQWTKRVGKDYPILNKIFAIPNGGKRHIATASRMKLEGTKRGVPDLFFPVARKGYHGLFIEMKRLKGGSVSKDQKIWKVWIEDEDYAWVRANGFEQAKNIMISYLDLPKGL